MFLTVTVNAAAFPLKHGGYVAAAYIVFLALILTYLVIMTKSLRKVSREVEEINQPKQKDTGSE